MTLQSTPASGLIVDAADLTELDDLVSVEELLAERGHASIGNLWGSAQALVLAAFALRPQQIGRAVLVVLNTNHEAVDVPWEPSGELLGEGKRISKIYDGETGFVFGPHDNKELRRKQFGENVPGRFRLTERAIRFIVIE